MEGSDHGLIWFTLPAVDPARARKHEKQQSAYMVARFADYESCVLLIQTRLLIVSDTVFARKFLI
jgi:hypothetical protein